MFQLKARLQEEQKRVQDDNKRIQENIKQLMKIQEKLKLQQASLKYTPKLPTNNFIPSGNFIPPQILTPPDGMLSLAQPNIGPSTIVQALPIYEAKFYQATQPTTTTTASLPTFDPFYTPILEKIDKVLVDIDYTEEPCRERLICSMYKNPQKFSPHSNLLSAELSR